MKRFSIAPRENWQERVERLGLEYHTREDGVFWDESAYYQFSSAEVVLFEKVVAEFNTMCLAAVDNVVNNDRFAQLGIPLSVVPLLMRSRNRGDLSLFTRYDLLYDGRSHPKLFYCQGDCPFLLIESEYIQSDWREEVFPQASQYNRVHECLRDVLRSSGLQARAVHFVSAHAIREQYEQIQYLEKAARDAGATAIHIDASELAWSEEGDCFVGPAGEQVEILVKYFPWELLLSDEFTPRLIEDRMQVIEPAWKLLLSSSGLLAVLWELYPGHPGLPECYFRKPYNAHDYEELPLFPQLAAEIGEVQESSEQHFSKYQLDHSRCVYRRKMDVPSFSDSYTALTGWVVGGKPAGIGVIEDDDPSFDERVRFVPHCVVD